MIAAPIPVDETERLQALRALGVLDTPVEPAFDALVVSAARLCGVKIALVSLIDEHRQWFKAVAGIEGVSETPRDWAFCAHAILQPDQILEVRDARADERFHDNPLVTGDPRIRFYAGVPLCTVDGHALGTLCLIDPEPRELDAEKRRLLLGLGQAAAALLDSLRPDQRALQRLHERMALATEGAGLGIWDFDVQNRTLEWDSRMYALYGVEPSSSLGPYERWSSCLHPDDRAAAEAEVAQVLEHGSMLENQFRIIHPDGQVRHIQVMAKVTRDAEGKAVRLTGVNWDITRQQELARELRHRASHDALTGLYNRAEFDARLRHALNEAQNLGATHALMYIDLDQFKLVNDACGHPVGDELLQEVTALFSRTVRGSDLLARLGGDEFAVILRDCTVEQALRVAQQICERMEEFRFMHGGRRFRVGASIGLVPIDRRWASTAAILQAADTACYSAKEAGRNRPHVWSESDTATRIRHGQMQWAARVEQALDENRYQLFAQRIVPIAHHDDRLHAEVLIRMVDEDGKLAPPGAFLEAAERFHLASRLDRWVLRNVLAWLRQQRNLDAIATIGVNLSGQSIGDAAFHRQALEMLANEDPRLVSRLCFEITETAAVTNLEDAGRFMHQLRDLGARFALDDFGAGASSFGYLKSLPIDYLKIDGQFVQDVLIDPLDEVTIKCFVDVARVLGVRTVAEFVDSRAVLERLGQLGVDHAQGYLIHAPAPIITLLPNPAG